MASSSVKPTRERHVFSIQSPDWPVIEGSKLVLALQIAPLLLMTALVVTKYWQDHPAIGWALVAVTAAVWFPEIRLRRARLWALTYVAGIFLYTLLRAYADETAISTKVQYAIDIDEFLFFGHVPTVWLQERLFDADNLSFEDYLATAIHWSFFVAPHAMAVAVFLWRRDLFPRYAILIVGTMYLGLLLFFLLPTAPPWLASELGYLPPLARVMDYVGAELTPGDSYNTLYESLGVPNAVAAMPSIHMGVTFAMALWAGRRYPRLAVGLTVYSAAMGLSLVYMAEHYVADLLAGMLCALVMFVVVTVASGRWSWLQREPRAAS